MTEIGCNFICLCNGVGRILKCLVGMNESEFESWQPSRTPSLKLAHVISPSDYYPATMAQYIPPHF